MIIMPCFFCGFIRLLLRACTVVHAGSVFYAAGVWSIPVYRLSGQFPGIVW